MPSYRSFGWFVPFAQISAGLAVLAVAPSSSAYAPSPMAHAREDFQVADGASPRSARAFSDRATTPAATGALHRLEGRLGPTFTSWDSATGVPAYVIPTGHRREGISADPSRAAALAGELVASHLDLLAPGCSSGDFTMVSNRLDGELRTVGYTQSHRGYPVVGGQFSLRLRRDHVTAITSQAIPCDALPNNDNTSGLEPAEATARAQAWVLETDDAAEATTLEVGAPVILPRIGDKGILRADLVIPVVVETSSPRGRWRVYVDAQSGAPIARETLLHYTAIAVYNVPRRGPLGPRYNAPAALINFNAGGQVLTADLNGNLPIDAPTGLTATVKSPFAAVYNASGDDATSDWVVSPGDTLTWDQRNDELVDAQLSAAIHTLVVKERVRSIDPTNPYLDQQITVNVNIDDICNAFSDGDSINFFMAGDGCANTGRLADVVYHEFGHSIHTQSLIPGVGAFHGALSEGISDYLSATITGDSGLARGFFQDNEPLREIDPDGFEWHWPEDQGEVHDEGRIIAGALWDLRKILRGKLGADAGTVRTDYLWYESIRRAVDLPSMYMESLIADDDDGILSNGTPNGCEIAAAYGAHGLRTISANVSDVSLEPQGPQGTPVTVTSDGLLANCPGSGLLGASLTWRERGQPGSGGTLPMLPDGLGNFVGMIPPQPSNVVVQYQIALKTASSSAQTLPKNAGDPWYEFYVGDVEPLYCTDFENDPFAEGWGLGGASSDFEWAPANGVSGLDPGAAFSGLFVIGNDVVGDGGYNPFSDALLASPQIDTAGYSTVRLQYRRWLSVEDGFYDQARIYAGGSTVWENYSSVFEDEASAHHVDGEWRFHDVDLSSSVVDGRVDVAFALLSDGGLEMGGWTIDDVCIVGVNAVSGICGDGLIDLGESCDDGNNLGGDGCSASCENEAGPTSASDTDTDTDGTGTGTDTDTDTDTDTSATGGAGFDLVGRGCVCTSDPDAPAGSGAWLALLALVSLRRRRR